MTATTQERLIFENEEWLVTAGGLEHKTTGYFIERESLTQRREDGLWAWPLHMAEKSWCAMMPFAEAFSCAASVYNVETGAELAQTFKVARCEVSPWPYAQNQAANPALRVPQPLRMKGVNPIFIEQGSAEKASDDQGLGSKKRMRGQAAGARPFSMSPRPSRANPVRAAALPWLPPRRIRSTGTRIVRMLQAAWNIR